MAVKCQTIINHLEKLAPKRWAESWDNVGLLVGDPKQQIKRILVALDTTLNIIDEAVEKNVDMIVAHHPIIFKPLKSIRKDQVQGEILYKVIQNNISVYCAHTNLDTAVGGLNDLLAEKIGLEQVEVLDPTIYDTYKKIVIFVPKGHEEVVLQAMAKAGAGWIGNYSECSFMVEGTGTFRPQQGTQPYIGTQGVLEKAEEIRLETICLESQIKRVVNAMLKVHPYEEVAYDIIPIELGGVGYGIGRIGKLDKELTLKEYASQVKQSLNVESLRIVGDLNKSIKKVALCSGSGASYIQKAYYKGADVLVTGDVKYHDAQEAEHLGMALIDAGHFGTEYIVTPLLKAYLEKLQDKTDDKLEVIISENNKELFQLI